MQINNTHIACYNLGRLRMVFYSDLFLIVVNLILWYYVRHIMCLLTVFLFLLKTLSSYIAISDVKKKFGIDEKQLKTDISLLGQK